ncbi:GMC oxidoreductase [Abortiporus biennis]|nr:GMC oxidoreductase [Abortiporus biennis]
MGSSLSRLVVSDPKAFATQVNTDDAVSQQDADKWRAYDYVVAGGGTAGCVVASRLSEDPNVTVLLIEAGKSEGDIFTRMPLTFTKAYETDIDWQFIVDPLEPCKREMKIARGKVLGGTSVINALIYDRCAPEDFDTWAKNGADGWTYENMEPYFRKAERYLPEKLLDKFDLIDKGLDGPLSRIHDVMVETCKTLGMKYNNDINSHEKLGVASFPACVDAHGTRNSTAAAYLTPEVLARPNLTVAVKNTVEKILFAPSSEPSGELKAIGVQLSPSPTSSSYRVKATREVIVCGGAIHSPSMLLLSGIGPKDELESVGVKCLKDLPVGKHFVDHVSCASYIVRTKPGYTLDYLGSSPFAAIKGIAQWLTRGTGVFSQLPVSGVAYLRTDDEKLVDTSLGHVKNLTSGPGTPDLEILWSPVIAPNFKTTGPPGTHGLSISAVALKAESEGSVTLKSNSPWEKPLVVGNYFSSESDLNTVIRGVKLIKKMTQTEPLKSIVEYDPPVVDKSSIFWPGNADPSLLTDEELRAWVLRNGHSACHPGGSCSIGPVVSPSLIVHGTTNVRVVDASIFPTQVSGHPMGVIIGMAERAADLIKGKAA